MAHQPDLVDVMRDESVAIVSLNRPDQYNAFDLALIEQLREALLDARQDDAIRAVVIAGNGKAFCAGGDLRSVSRDYPDAAEGFHRLASVFNQTVTEIRIMSKPVVAAVNGYAVGGGFSLALACDLRVLGESAVLQQAYTSNGLVVDGAGTFTLPRIVGLAKALEIVMLDEPIAAHQALDLGLATKVVPDEDVRTAAQELAAKVGSRAIGSIGKTKRLLNASFDTSLETQMEAERQQLELAVQSPEGQEGVQAFLDKRPPAFNQ